MNFMPAKGIKRDFLMHIMLLQLMVYVTVFFDIPIARQVLGFFYFTFLPGFVILKLLKLDEFDWVETVLFSVGLSIAFLMIAGLVVNEFSLLFGVSQPLSLVPLMIILNSLILMGGVLVYFKSEDMKIWNSEPVEKSPFVLLFLCLPILSIVGAMYVNAYGNNLLLLFMIIAISLLFIVGVLSKKRLSSKLYPFAVLMIVIAILYHSSLISNYIVSFGSDVTFEYFLFKTTEGNAHWSSTLPSSWGIGYGRLNAMLSITILPTVYANILNINSTWVFKMLYPLIFSFVPLGLYQVWQAYVGKKYAFTSAFLFMAQATFYTEMFGLNRQMISELFFVMLLIVILNKKMKSVNKTVCFMVFSFALVTSHYALAEIFLFLISFVLISLIVLKRPSRNITVSMVVFFFAVMFTWYIYTSGSTVFDSFLEFGDHVYRQLGDFFDPASRGQTVLRGLGMEPPPTVWNSISRVFAYLTQALIVFGFVGLITRRVKPNFDREYYVLTSFAMVLLAALILVPGLANTLNMARFYHILLFLLAPLCVLGAETLARFLHKRKTQIVTSILLLTILTPYFLFQTNFVYEVTGSESWSLPLSKYRMQGSRLVRIMGYIPEQNVFGAYWLAKYVDTQHSQLYADLDSRHKALVAYGVISSNNVNILYNTTKIEANGTVYLGWLNVVDGIVDSGSVVWNSSENSFSFDDLAKIYSNGGCEVYKNVVAKRNG
jgi:uncharacterized membrane protein